MKHPDPPPLTTFAMLVAIALPVLLGLLLTGARDESTTPAWTCVTERVDHGRVSKFYRCSGPDGLVCLSSSAGLWCERLPR